MTRALVIGALLALSACSRQHSRPPYTESDVRTFVQAGTPREAIIKRFGQPVADDSHPKFEDGYNGIDEIMYYNLPPWHHQPIRNEGWSFAGFQVRLKDGKAVEWMATHSN